MSNVQYWHTGFLTDDIEKTVESFSLMPGAEKAEIIEIGFDESEMKVGTPMTVKVCNLVYQGMVLELIQPVNCPDNFMAKELAKKGNGIHHLAYALPDCYEETVAKLVDGGWKLNMAACKGGTNNCFVTSPEGTTVLELIERIPG